MKQKHTLIALLAALAAVSGLSAGERCTAETTVCIRHMVEQIRAKGWIGIDVQHDEGQPARIEQVVVGSPAEKAGMRAGDQFLALNGVRYAEMESDSEIMKRTKEALKPGNRVTFTVGRDGKELDLVVYPSAVPDHILAQWVGKHVMEHHMAPAETSRAAESAKAPEAPSPKP